MLLFQKRFHQGLVLGTVRLTFRRWDKARVRVGGRYRVHPIGVVEVDAVERVAFKDITEADAKLSGFDTLAQFRTYVKEAPAAEGQKLTPTSEFYKVTLHHGGDGDRVEIALDTNLSAEDVAAIQKRLQRFDEPTPWTRKVLEQIRAQPRVAASKLAAVFGRETEPFKIDVRRLKKLGLTQSFEVGYELSPRGVRFLELEAAAAVAAKPARRKVQKRKS